MNEVTCQTPEGSTASATFFDSGLVNVVSVSPPVGFSCLLHLSFSTTAEHDIRSLNPYMSSTAYKTVTILTIVAMLTSNRVAQTHRALTR